MIRRRLQAALRRYGLPGALVLLCGLFLVQTLSEVHRRRAADMLLERSSTWSISQASYELGRLRRALSEYRAGSDVVDPATLAHRFEIYWSRIPLLAASRQITPLLLQKIQAERTVPTLIGDLERIEPWLEGLVQDDGEAFLRIERILDAHNKILTELDLASKLEAERAWDEELAMRRAPMERVRILFVGLALSVAGIFALLLTEIRKSRRLLASAESARVAAADATDDLHAVIDAVPALIAVTSREGRLLLVNRFTRTLHGLADQRIEGQMVSALGLTAADRGGFWTDIGQNADQPAREQLICDAHGRERTLLGAQVPMRDEGGEVRRTVRVALDITERKLAEARIHHLAHHDPLTDLPNRGFFHDRLREALAQPRGPGAVLAVLCIDADRFKEVNDTMGHPVGDALLIGLAKRMLGCLRSNDFLARLGGDEFAVIQHGLRDAAEASAIAARIIAETARPFQIGAHEVQAGVSVGIHVAAEDGGSAEDVIRRADLALYRAKADGRNRYHLFVPELEEHVARRHGLEQDLRRAIERRELHLAFQPKFRLADHALVGFEALLRWRHAERGLIPPDQFIPMAEETGLIVPMGAWVLEEACRRARAWNQLSSHPVPVAVNLSPAQFSRDDVVATVEAALSASGLAADLLELEITETVLMRSYDQALEVIHRLRRRGLGVSLDDFGTGYSSLGHLHRLPLDRLKIDRAFVTELGSSGTATAIVRAIVTLAQTLRMTVTAEGVETEAQLDQLREIGCDEAQGFLLGRPMEAQAAMAMVESAASPIWSGRLGSRARPALAQASG